MVPAKMSFSPTGCAYLKLCFYILKNVSKSLKKFRCKMQFDGENESVTVEFMWNDILARQMPISVRNYKVMFSVLLF
jgi:hypothetical protein